MPLQHVAQENGMDPCQFGASMLRRVAGFGLCRGFGLLLQGTQRHCPGAFRTASWLLAARLTVWRTKGWMNSRASGLQWIKNAAFEVA
jgi:hypothetical protein